MTDKAIKRIQLKFDDIINDLNYLKEATEKLEFETKEVRRRDEIVNQKDQVVSKKLIEVGRLSDKIITDKAGVDKERKDIQNQMAIVTINEEKLKEKREDLTTLEITIDDKTAKLEFLEKRKEELNDYKQEIDKQREEVGQERKLVEKEKMIMRDRKEKLDRLEADLKRKQSKIRKFLDA